MLQDKKSPHSSCQNKKLVESTDEFIQEIKNVVDNKYVFKNTSEYIKNKLEPQKIYNKLYKLFKIYEK